MHTRSLLARALFTLLGGAAGACGSGDSAPAGSAPDGSLAGDVVTTPGDAAAPQPDGPASDASAWDAPASEGAADGASGDAPGMDAPTGPDSSSDGSMGACPALPTGGLYATLADPVRNSVSHLWVDNQTGIDELLAYWHGTSTGGLPVGPLVCMPVNWNCPYHFFIDPQTIQFADASEEGCQGWDLEVESNCPAFQSGSGGCYSPLGETITEVRDCRTDSTCPVVPK